MPSAGFWHLSGIAAALILAMAPAACAEPDSAARIEARGAWASATIGNVPNSAAYLQLRNSGSRADVLVGVSSPAAARAELHTHKMDGGMMRMRRIAQVNLPAGKTVAFRPGGSHIMLIGLKEPLTAGDEIKLTLRFRHAKPLTLSVPVRGR